MFSSTFSRLLEFRPHRVVTNSVIALLLTVLGFIVAIGFYFFNQNSVAIFAILYGMTMLAAVIGGFRSSLWSMVFSLIGLVICTYVNVFPAGQIRETWVITYLLGSLVVSYVISLIKNSYQISLSVLNNLSSYVLILSPGGIIKDVNRSLLERFELEREELIGKSMMTSVPWSYSATARQALELAIQKAKKGVSSRFDLKLLRQFRSSVFVDFSISPIFDRQRNIIKLVVCATDIGMRVAAEAKVTKINRFLQRQLNEMQTLFDLIPIGIGITHDAHLKEVRVNQTFRKMFDEQQLDVPALSVRSSLDEGATVQREGRVVPPKEWAMRRAIKQKKSFKEIELSLQKKDGSELRYLEYAAPIIDEKGTVTGSIGAFVDITDRKKVEAALLKSELRFKRLVDSNIIGVILIKLQGEIVEANEAFLNMLGYDQDDVGRQQLDWRQLTPAEFKDSDLTAVAQLEATGECRPYEKEFFRKDGTGLPILIGIAKLETASDLCIAFILDISAQKKLERRKDEFIGLASHELKTPLTSIKVFTQLLERSLKIKEDTQNLIFIQKMSQQIDRLRTLVEDMLDVSKIEAGKLSFNYELTDVNQLVADSIYEVQSISPNHQIKLEGNIANPVSIDAYRVGQVVTNLLTNAIKYSPLAQHVLVTLSETPTMIQTSVRDFGVGIPITEQKRIFEKFARARGKNRHSFPGLGLGLYVSQRIIDRHQGKIWVESKENEGSVFSFQLPKQRSV